MNKPAQSFKEHQVEQKKKGIDVQRVWGATREQEMTRRADLREGAAISLPELTLQEMQGKTMRLKTGKYISAGRFKNVPAGNR